MTPDIILKVGEVGVVYTFQIFHEDGTLFDLTGYTVTLLVGTEGARAVTIVTAASGICSYPTVASDTSKAKGGLKWRLHLAKSTTNIYDLEAGNFSVIEEKLTA